MATFVTGNHQYPGFHSIDAILGAHSHQLASPGSAMLAAMTTDRDGRTNSCSVQEKMANQRSGKHHGKEHGKF